MVDLASLVVKLEAETSQYSAAITKATEQMGSFSDKVGESIRDVAKDLLALETLKKVFDFTENIVKTIASFDQLSHAVGATTETLSQLSFAGKLSGIDDIAVPLEKLGRSVGEVATGNQKLTDTFSALGVSIRDSGGKIKSTDQQLLDIADAVSKYNDGLAKTSAVQAIFGRSGAEFIKFLDQGAAGIKAAQQEAIDLGVSVSSSSAQAADEFESNMTRIGAAIEGIFFKALEEVLPKFQAITDQIIEFAKGAGNTEIIVEQLAAGFKIIGTVLVIIGTAFEAVGKAIGAVTGLIGIQIRALGDLATAFLHPIQSFKDYAAAQREQIGILKDAAQDILSTIKAGATAAGGIWGNLDDQLTEVSVTAKKIKPDLVLIDQTQIKAIESAIEALAKLDDTLKQQVETYGLSGAAATVYDVTLGKLSASVDELNKKNPGSAKSALADLEKQGKLSKASIDEINAAIAAGVPIGDAFKTSIINSATALDKLKGVDALSKLDSQLLTMTGRLEEASKAAFDLANRPLEITIQTAQDKTAFSGLDDTQKTAAATQQLNDLKQQAITIEDALGKKVAEVDAAAAASGENNLKVAGDEAAARQAAIAQLGALYVKAQALADATGLKSAADQAHALRDAIGAIQFNPKILEDVDKATEAQKRFNEALKNEKDANDDLSLQLATLAKQNADGALTDLEYAAKQDDARQRAIEQLTAIQQQELEVIKNNPGNAQALDDYKKLGVQITGLQTQIGQLAKTVRTDLTDDITNAFVDFADGTKSAKDALRSFVEDFGKQMLQLGAKQLFQKLFDTTGISSGINSLFSKASKALPAAAAATGDLASTTAAATSMSTAITTAATAGGTALGTAVETAATAGATALGTGITTSATAGATEIGAGITTAATAAATEMATAITAAGAEAAAAMAAAIEAAGAASGATSGAETALIAAAAGGGPIPANQLTLVGEKGPELLVSDVGPQTAATATKVGTAIPEDLTHAHVIGTQGPEFIRPNVSGFVVPSDTFIAALADRAAPPAIPTGPDVTTQTREPSGKRQEATNVPAGLIPESPVVPGPDVRDDAPPAPTRARTAALVSPEIAATPISTAERHGSLRTEFARPLAPVIDLVPLIAARLPAIPAPTATEALQSVSATDAAIQLATPPTRAPLPPTAAAAAPIRPEGPSSVGETPPPLISAGIEPTVPTESPPIQRATSENQPSRLFDRPEPPPAPDLVDLPVARASGEALQFPEPPEGVERSERIAPNVGQAHPLAPVTDLVPLLATTLPAREERLFGRPGAISAEKPEAAADVDATAPIRATVESRGAPPIERAPAIPSNVIVFPPRPPQPPELPTLSAATPPRLVSAPEPPDVAGSQSSNVIAFPTPKQPVSGGEFAATMLDAASALPPAPDRLDTEVTRASAPEAPAQLDEPTSAMIVKFEKIVKHEQADLLDAHEYEALLTDRYLQKRQSGGPVTAGKPYLVGEGGVELMVPDSNGTVMNSWDTQNNRAVVNNVTNHFAIATPTGKVDRASQSQIAARTAASVQAASSRNN